MNLFLWDSAPEACRVAFSTRLGGVSEGPFSSRNLGVFTGDEPARVFANRRLLCEELEVDPVRATMARQVHGAHVAEASPLGILAGGVSYGECDGLWTDRRGQPMLLLTADCFPVALATAEPSPRLAVLHVGWRGLLAGIVEAGV
ncbi:MAG: laccase domain-containing protein, partial [Thermoleophilia bacterium]|nr:laccase domain-containing protein [Thermoleophilia bacterium]